MLQYLIEEYLPGYPLPVRLVTTEPWSLNVATSTVYFRDRGGDIAPPLDCPQMSGLIALRVTGEGCLLVLQDTRKEYRFIYNQVTNEYVDDFHQYLD